MIIAQQNMPMNRYEMWVVIAGIGAQLAMTWLNRQKAAIAAEKAAVAVEKADGLEAKLDDVRLTIDGGLKTMMDTIRAEGHASGMRDERRRAGVEPEPTNAGPTDRPAMTGHEANTAALLANTAATDANTEAGVKGKP